MVLAGPVVAAPPDCTDPTVSHPSCKDDGSTLYFKFIFAGTESIFHEHNDGAPWEATRPPKSPLVGGPVTIYADRIAWVGDYDDPCGVMSELDECSARLGGQLLQGEDIRFAATGEGGDDPGSVGLFFSFNLWFEPDPDPSSPENPPIPIYYEYIAKPQGLADLVAHPWDPADPFFCVPMAFDRTWILQYTPVIKQRQKKCPDSQYFAVCEADDAEEHWPFSSAFFSEFRVIIWRADHPDYDPQESPLTPPCTFDGP
jgi:hypothetical protein